MLLLPLVLTFVVAFGSVCGVYWLVVLRPESAARQTVTRRLRPSKAPLREREPSTIVRQEAPVSSIPVLETVLTSAGEFTRRAQRLLDSADVQMTVGRFLLASLLLGLGTFVAVGVFLGMGTAGLLLAPVAAAIPIAYVRRMRQQRFRRFEEQFPDAIDLIARAMRAGHGLAAGLGMVADELPQPVGREFRMLYDWQNFGMSLPEALHRFATRVPILDARFFVTAVLTQRESGGNLAEVLDNLSRVIRERFRVKRQIRVLSAHGRLTGAILGGMPVVLALYFLLVRPDYLQELTADPLGVRMVFAAIALQILGVFIIRRLIDIEY